VAKPSNFYPVILAGGRGTRFWPLSRRRCAKQLLPLDGKKTMIQQTLERLLPLAPAKRVWVITNDDLRSAIVRQVPKLDKRQIVAEPIGRNTAPAVGLAAFLLLRSDPKAVIGLFPSDHVIGDDDAYRKNIERAVETAASGEKIVVLGIKPTRAETGYGYIEAGSASDEGVLRVLRFTEKPNSARAAQFLAAGNYYWNSGMFLWSAQTLANALREHLPNTAAILERIAATYGTRKFEATFRKLYSKCDNISVDYALLEPRSAKGEGFSSIYCIPSEFGWNDLGSWTALHEHRTAKEKTENANVLVDDGSFMLDTSGNYVHAPGKFVAAIGVKDLVVVDTGDALLITTRDRAQDVGKVVKYLDDKKLSKLT
jgi:mannose-1-phosphate guanylyltransferase